MRCATARTVVLAMKLGRSLADAVKLAVEELDELTTGFLAGVVIHAVDASGNHEVVNFRCRQRDPLLALGGSDVCPRTANRDDGLIGCFGAR